MKSIILATTLFFTGCGVLDLAPLTNLDENTTTKIISEANKTVTKIKNISVEDVKKKTTDFTTFMKKKAEAVKKLAKEELDKSWKDAKKKAGEEK